MISHKNLLLQKHKMTSSVNFKKINIDIQPKLSLIDIFEESIEYKRTWCLPFNSLCLCEDENREDPSWVDLTEKKRRIFFEKGSVYFTTCNTPMHIKYTTANLHRVIHFKYEIFPGFDLFSGIHDRFVLSSRDFIESIRAVFAETVPLRKIAMAGMSKQTMTIINPLPVLTTA